MLNGLKKIFIKKSSTSKFGIALRRQVGSFAVVDKSTDFCKVDEFFTETTDSVGDWLEELLSSHTFSGSGTLVLSSSHFHSVQIDKPDLPEDEIGAALKWLVKDIVPIEPEEMVVDYSDSPIIVGGTQKINVVCAHLSHLKKFTDSFKRYQVKLTGITTDEFAFANLAKPADKPTLLLCQQPFEDLLLLIIVNGQIHLSRRLRGFNEIGGYSQEQLMNGICDSLSIELQKSLDYFERQLKQAPVASIQVILPVQHEEFIIERLNANANITVQKLELEADYAEHRHCAASVGAIVETSIREAQRDE